MDMKMEDNLAGFGSIIDLQGVIVLNLQCRGDFLYGPSQPRHDVRAGLLEAVRVIARADQEMDIRLGVDMWKGHEPVFLVDKLARNLSGDDFAEQAVLHFPDFPFLFPADTIGHSPSLAVHQNSLVSGYRQPFDKIGRADVTSTSLTTGSAETDICRASKKYRVRPS